MSGFPRSSAGLDSLSPGPSPARGEGSLARFAMTVIEAYLGGAHQPAAGAGA